MLKHREILSDLPHAVPRCFFAVAPLMAPGDDFRGWREQGIATDRAGEHRGLSR